VNVAALGQFPTPCWLAEQVVDRYFADLGSDDVVLDPTAGRGHFLAAIPDHVPAFGVELDPAEAALGRAISGRDIVVGDVRTVDLARRPTVLIGNPPFRVTLLDAILRRAHTWLPDGGRVGFIVPIFAFQTASRLLRYAQDWSIEQTLIPRNTFDLSRTQRLRYPICFSLFRKDRRRTLVGFAFYAETDALQRLAQQYRTTLHQGGRQVWRQVVQAALTTLGGEAPLAVIYHEVEGRRPTANPFWREKVRQTLQLHCRRIGPGRYALPSGGSDGQRN
jgi:site-specific DNA-methyltransferase (adenine-specific)